MKLRSLVTIFAAGAACVLIESLPAQDEALYVAPSGNVGLGTNAPERQLHLKGASAVFRMDRPVGTSAFLLVRVDGGGTPLKSYVVGTDAFGSDNGEFVINDLGTAVSGAGSRRMTIQNSGDVAFTGSVSAVAFNPTSSIRYKQHVEPIADPLALAQQLNGVRFDWKASGQPSIGFIAEEVEAVLPELVAHDPGTGEVAGLNYDAIVPVLVEALKAQQADFEAKFDAQQQRITELEQQVAEQQSIQARLAKVEALLQVGMPEGLLVTN